MPLQPTVLWAQRKDRLFLTIDLQDCKDPKVTLDSDDNHGTVSFRGHATSHATGPEEHSYILDLQLYGPIDKEDTKISQTDRTILLVIAKKGEDFWPRLLKQPGKTSPNIKVDWDKWVDEDEEDEAADKDMGFDMSQFQNFSNFGDMGGMSGDFGAVEEDDSDDDDDGQLPELVKS